MAAAVVTVTKPTGVQHTTVSNKKMRFFDITTDTGNYSSGGFTVTARQFGLSGIDALVVCSVSTSGSAGATALPVGVIYTGRTSVTIQHYEGSAAGTILGEKTNAEAMPSNQTVRVVVFGT